MAAPRQTAVQRGAWPRAPDTSARTFRLGSPFLLNLRRHLELDGMQKPRSPAIGKNEQPVVTAHRGCPFLLPRRRVAKKVDVAQAARVTLMRGEVRQQLERRTRMEVAVVAGLQQEETTVVDGAI